MLKYIFVGVWACVVSLGSAYGVMYWKTLQAQHAANPVEVKPEYEQVKTRMISVPMVYDGAVQGYVLAQFTFTVEVQAMKAAAVKPDLYLVDEAFRLIYAGEVLDFRKLRKPNIAALAQLIKENVNKHYGGKEVVHEVFVQELNYLPKEQFRGGTPSK